MTPAAIRALAARVETEEPSQELRAAVLAAFGCEADWEGAPDPLVFVDDAKAFQPDGWDVTVIQKTSSRQPTLRHRWTCFLQRAAFPVDNFEEGKAPTEPRARTAAALHALAWEKENADG